MLKVYFFMISKSVIVKVLGVIAIGLVVAAFVYYKKLADAFDNRIDIDPLLRGQKATSAHRVLNLLRLVGPVFLVLLMSFVKQSIRGYVHFEFFELFVFIMGLLFAYIGIGIKNSTEAKKVSCPQRGTAQIISFSKRYRENEDGHTREVFVPRISYTINGKSIEKDADYEEYNEKKIKVSEFINIYVNPQYPKSFISENKIKFNKSFEFWFTAVGYFMILCGTMLCELAIPLEIVLELFLP